VWPGSHDPSSETDLAYLRRFVDAGASRVMVARYCAPDATGDPTAGLPALRDQLLQFRSLLDSL